MSVIWIAVVLFFLLVLFGGYGARSGYYGYPAYGGGLVTIVVVLLVIWLLFYR